MKTPTAQYRFLAWAGALPFIACAGLSAAGYSQIPVVGSVTTAAATYGLAIASFLAGIHWATDLYRGDEAPPYLVVTSNVTVILAWLTIVLAPAVVTLLVLVAAFAGLLSVDYRLHAAGLLEDDYFAMRRNVTAIVVISLLTTAAFAGR